MDESVPLQFAEADVLQFIRKNGEGTQVTLDLGSEKTNAVVKSSDYNPMKKQVMAFDLQALVQGEVISTFGTGGNWKIQTVYRASWNRIFLRSATGPTRLIFWIPSSLISEKLAPEIQKLCM